MDKAHSTSIIIAFQRILRIFTAPEATFQDIKQSTSKADYIVPLVILMLVALGGRVIVLPLEYDRQVQSLEQRDDILDAQKDVIFERMDSWFEKSLQPLGQIVGLAANLAWLAIQAGALMFVAVMALGGTGTYWMALLVVCYAQMINIVGAIVKLPLIIQAQSLDIETGLALLLPRSLDGSLLYRFSHRLDLFTIWMIWVVSLGMATMFNIDQRRTKQVYFGAWTVLMFVLVLLVDGRIPT